MRGKGAARDVSNHKYWYAKYLCAQYDLAPWVAWRHGGTGGWREGSMSVCMFNADTSMINDGKARHVPRVARRWDRMREMEKQLYMMRDLKIDNDRRRR